MSEADTLPELADDDLDVLLEALEAWESKDVAGDMMTDILDSVLTRQHGGMPLNVAADRERDKLKKAQAKKWRKERSVLLRAKLIQIRDRRRAEHLTRDALA